jgi:hypothetical protein
VATLQLLCAQCMEPASRWRVVWAVSRMQARWRGLLGRKRAETEQRRRASAEAEHMSAAERNRIANQAAQIARGGRAQVTTPLPHTLLLRYTPPPPPPPPCRRLQRSHRSLRGRIRLARCRSSCPRPQGDWG